MRTTKVTYIAVTVVASIVALDQLVKWVIGREIGSGTGRSGRWLAGDWLGLSYLKNTGIAFGFLEGASTIALIAAALATLAVIGSFVWIHRESTSVSIAGAIIIGGAIGNLVDRVRLGYVRDVFVVGPWPTFNVADSAITVGVFLALLGVLRTDLVERRSADIVPPKRQSILDTTK